MPSTTWDPDLYLRHADHRDRPFFDLTARIGAGAPRLVVDVGCGPGHLTAALAERWPAARVLGLDSSAEMVDAARARYDPGGPASESRLGFAQADARTWHPEPGTDVVVTNAMLQWVPGHVDLVGRWLDALEPGAWFAAQVPGNFEAPSHALMRQVARSPRWVGKLRGVLRHADAVAEPADYLRLLLSHGFSADAWETGYQQVLEGPDPVLDWVRGTALRPVMDALDGPDGEQYADFEQQYAPLLRAAYPAFAGPDGRALTVFPFRRIFFVGRKEG